MLQIAPLTGSDNSFPDLIPIAQAQEVPLLIEVESGEAIVGPEAIERFLVNQGLIN